MGPGPQCGSVSRGADQNKGVGRRGLGTSRCRPAAGSSQLFWASVARRTERGVPPEGRGTAEHEDLAGESGGTARAEVETAADGRLMCEWRVWAQTGCSRSGDTKTLVLGVEARRNS